jgi:hypothetical protein
MEIPWSASDQRRAGEPAPGEPALIMGSRFELSSAWRSPAFLMHALRIWRQARHSPGILGVSLRAHPVAGIYWTLSAWTDEAALRAFAGTDPHRTIMKRARPWTKSATFRFWTADDLAPSRLWADAVSRIAGPE